MSLRIKSVTPKTAQTYLDVNKYNRPLDEDYAKDIAAEYAAGRWPGNGDGREPLATISTISFDTRGRLIDGQHRLRAVVLHGKPISFFVQTECHPEDIFLFDGGRLRNGGHALTVEAKRTADIRGEETADVHVAHLNALKQACRFWAVYTPATGRFDCAGRIRRVKNAEIVAASKAKGLVEWTERSVSINKLGQQGVFGAFFAAAARKDAALAESIFSKLHDGCSKGDPVWPLYNRCLDTRGQRRHGSSAYWLIEALSKTWNALRKGETLSKLPATTTGGTDIQAIR